MRGRFAKLGGPLVALIALILIFGSLETFQRIKDYLKWRKHTHTPYMIRFETWSGSPLTEKRGSLVLVHHPHLIYTFKKSQKRPEATINAQGFRGKEWKNPQPQQCRIIVLGGSAAFGQGASGDGTVFTVVLERLLNRSADRTVEVLNAGVTGYHSAQEFVLTATVLLDYHPDLMMIFDGWNDFYISSVVPPGMKEPVSSTFLQFDEILSINTQRWMNVLRISSFMRWGEQKVRSALRASAQPRKFHNFSDNLVVYLPHYKKTLERMVRIARAHGSEIILAPQPEIFQRKGVIPQDEEALRVTFSQGRYEGYAELAREQYPAFIKAAREVADAEGATFIDSPAAFDDFRGVAFVDFVHFGDEGHERLAHYLLPTVSRVLDEQVRNSACHQRVERS